MTVRIPILLAASVIVALGIGDFERGNRLYRAGNYIDAVAAYRAALESGHDSPQLRYNLGTALLRTGQFAEAQEHLELAVGTVEPEVLQRAVYNLGTAYLMAGRAETDPVQRVLYLENAIEAFKDALRLDPADMDAKWNLELSLRFRDNVPEPDDGGDDGDQGENDQSDDGSGDPQEQGAPPTAGPQQQDDSEQRLESAPLTQEEADRILSAAEQSEREVVRGQLGRGSRDSPVERDW